ncbi:MAG: hypothetical protein ABIR32_05450, partial [Ilumatobacteraceae bacterium]
SSMHDGRRIARCRSRSNRMCHRRAPDRLGIAGAALMFATRLIASFDNTPVTGCTFLIAPITVQEIMFAIWPLSNGFAQGATEA